MTPWALAGEILRIVRLWLELKVRRQLIDEVEKIEREQDQLAKDEEAAFSTYRNGGGDAALHTVERLRRNSARRARLSAFVTAGLAQVDAWDRGSNAGRALQPNPAGSLDVRTEVPGTDAGKPGPGGSPAQSGS